MSVWQSLGGMRQVRLTSADPAGALHALQDAGITMLDLCMDDPLTWRFSVSRRDSEKARKLVEKRGEKYDVICSYGIIWTILALYRRPVLLLGMVGLLLLSFWVPSRVFFVQVQGNVSVPTRLIAEEAIACGISFGASRREVRSERVKNQLLTRLPQLQWAGVNTSGCVAVITVRERTSTEISDAKGGVCSIVASRDGVIHEMTVLRGNGLCKPGQAVKAGQVLISGYTDCGIAIQAEHADGEILAHTIHSLTAVFPKQRQIRGRIQRTEEKYSVIIGKKQINFYKDSGISGNSCAKIYEQRYMTLPGGFLLPVCIVREQWIYYDSCSGWEKDPAQFLTVFAEKYITHQSTVGKIEYAQKNITATAEAVWLNGTYGCLENIGVVRVEENLPNYGKSD